MTEFLVLSRDAHSGAWLPLDKQEARTYQQAVRLLIGPEPLSGLSGQYVAVPARSWRPLEVRAEQKTKVTIEAVEEAKEEAPAAASS